MAIALVFIFTVPFALAADAPQKVQRSIASEERSDVARVQSRDKYRPELSELVSYDILMRLPERDRIQYLQGVRTMLVELEDLTSPMWYMDRAKRQSAANGSKAKSRLVAELDLLIHFFEQPSKSASVVVPRLIGGDQQVSCPAPYYPVGNAWFGYNCYTQPSDGTWSSWASRFPAPTGVIATYEPVPASIPNQAPAPATVPAPQPAPLPAAPATALAPSQTPYVYDPKDADAKQSYVANEKQAGDGYNQWAAAAEKKSSTEACGFKPLKKQECDQTSDADKRTKGLPCFIGGIQSQYSANGYCKPVTTLCYDDQGQQMVGDKCQGDQFKKKKFACKAGETVCSVDIGRRTSENKLTGDETNASNGAFCAPASGNGAKSASALCWDLADKYSSKTHKVSDILDTANNDAAQAKKRWEGLKTSLKTVCGSDQADGKSTKANCEACQVMRYKTAQLRHELFQKTSTGTNASGSCLTDDQFEAKLDAYYRDCAPPKKCGVDPARDTQTK